MRCRFLSSASGRPLLGITVTWPMPWSYAWPCYRWRQMRVAWPVRRWSWQIFRAPCSRLPGQCPVRRSCKGRIQWMDDEILKHFQISLKWMRKFGVRILGSLRTARLRGKGKEPVLPGMLGKLMSSRCTFRLDWNWFDNVFTQHGIIICLDALDAIQQLASAPVWSWSSHVNKENPRSAQCQLWSWMSTSSLQHANASVRSYCVTDFRKSLLCHHAWCANFAKRGAGKFCHARPSGALQPKVQPGLHAGADVHLNESMKLSMEAFLILILTSWSTDVYRCHEKLWAVIVTHLRMYRSCGPWRLQILKALLDLESSMAWLQRAFVHVPKLNHAFSWSTSCNKSWYTHGFCYGLHSFVDFGVPYSIDYKVIHGAVGIQKTEPSRCAQIIVLCNATKTEERCFCWQPWMAGQPWITYESLSGPRNSTQISR